jgi:hypothetical protein
MPAPSARCSPGRRPSKPWANHRRTGLTSPTRVWSTQAKTASGQCPRDSALGASSAPGPPEPHPALGSGSAETAGDRLAARGCWTDPYGGRKMGKIQYEVQYGTEPDASPGRPRPASCRSSNPQPPASPSALQYWPRRRAARPLLQLRPLAPEEMGFGLPPLIICIVTFPGERQSETVWATQSGGPRARYGELPDLTGGLGPGLRRQGPG